MMFKPGDYALRDYPVNAHRFLRELNGQRVKIVELGEHSAVCEQMIRGESRIVPVPVERLAPDTDLSRILVREFCHEKKLEFGDVVISMAPIVSAVIERWVVAISNGTSAKTCAVGKTVDDAMRKILCQIYRSDTDPMYLGCSETTEPSGEYKGAAMLCDRDGSKIRLEIILAGRNPLVIGQADVRDLLTLLTETLTK